MSEFLSEKELRKGAKEFEFLFLLPKGSDGKEINIRLRINNKWSGWTIRDEVINGVGLEVGNTILTRVEPMFLNGLIDDDDDIVLFAEGDAARWIIENNITIGSVIDCRVKFSYSKIDLDNNSKGIYRVALILENGYSAIPSSSEEIIKDDDIENRLRVEETLEKLFGSNKI